MSDEKEPIVGIVSFANGEEFSYTDPEEYLRVIKEELPYHPTTGFRYKTLTDDPDIRNAVDDLLYDLYGEENPARRSTDMDGVKDVAKMLLAVELAETEFSPMIVQHPFTNSGIAGIPMDGELKLLNLCENPEDLVLWRNSLSKAIDTAENLWTSTCCSTRHTL